jgi:hypothetical protein
MSEAEGELAYSWTITEDLAIEHINELITAIEPVLEQKGLRPNGSLPVDVIYTHTLALSVLAEQGRRALLRQEIDVSRIPDQVDYLVRFEPKVHEDA